MFVLSFVELLMCMTQRPVSVDRKLALAKSAFLMYEVTRADLDGVKVGLPEV